MADTMSTSFNLSIRTLLPSERLVLYRRRRGWTQRDAAVALSVSERTYWAMEKGTVKLQRVPRIEYLTRTDQCLLARIRHGLGLRETAEAFGISHTTLLDREIVADKKLIAAWEGLGYRFY